VWPGLSLEAPAARGRGFEDSAPATPPAKVSTKHLTPKRVPADSATRSFPAVIDTGFNRTLLLQEQHLREWAGLRRERLKKVDEIRAYGRAASVLAANVWLHPNIPGTRELAGAPPFCIHLDPGIAVCPSDVSQPRLPLLGLAALRFGDLQVFFQWRRMAVTIRTTPWWFRLFA
jgi:hypothetical protein